jgi:hypothetical protein
MVKAHRARLVQSKGTNSMIYIFVAITISGSIWYSMQGIAAATYVLLTLLSFNMLATVFIASAMLGLKLDRPQILSKEQQLNSTFLIRLMLLASVWHLYTLGYVFIAGAFMVTVIISLLTIIFASLEQFAESKK